MATVAVCEADDAINLPNPIGAGKAIDAGVPSDV